MATRLFVLAMIGSICCGLVSCGGGGSDDSGGSSGACERISAGSSELVIRNELATGVRAFLPQFAFGADMLAGECNIVGMNIPASLPSVQVELTRCNNTQANSDCDGRLVAPTRTQSVSVPQGGRATLTITASMF